MKYEICVRPYDRTPEGNLPKYYTKEFNSDREALAGALALNPYTGEIDSDDLEEYTDKSIDKLKALLLYFDPSDVFIFYVKNETEGTILFDSGEDPKEWEADYYRDEDEDDYWDDEDEDDDLPYDAIDNFKPWQ